MVKGDSALKCFCSSCCTELPSCIFLRASVLAQWPWTPWLGNVQLWSKLGVGRQGKNIVGERTPMMIVLNFHIVASIPSSWWHASLPDSCRFAWSVEMKEELMDEAGHIEDTSYVFGETRTLERKKCCRRCSWHEMFWALMWHLTREVKVWIVMLEYALGCWTSPTSIIPFNLWWKSTPFWCKWHLNVLRLLSFS